MTSRSLSRLRYSLNNCANGRKVGSDSLQGGRVVRSSSRSSETPHVPPASQPGPGAPFNHLCTGFVTRGVPFERVINLPFPRSCACIKERFPCLDILHIRYSRWGGPRIRALYCPLVARPRIIFIRLRGGRPTSSELIND